MSKIIDTILIFRLFSNASVCTMAVRTRANPQGRLPSHLHSGSLRRVSHLHIWLACRTMRSIQSNRGSFTVIVNRWSQRLASKGDGQQGTKNLFKSWHRVLET